MCASLLLHSAMSDELIWVSAQLPHPFEPDTRVQMWWQEDRDPGVRGAGVPPPPTVTPVASGASSKRDRGAYAGASPKRGSHGWGSSSDDDDHNSSRRVPTPWVSSSSQPLPPPDDRMPTTPAVHLPPGIQSPPASDADGSLTGFCSVDCPLRLRVDEALSSYRENDRDWSDAWHTHQSCSSSRHATLISHLFADCEPAPEFSGQSPRGSPGPSLKSDQYSRRQTDKLQILSWNPDLARGSDPSSFSSHLNGPWHVVCVQEGAGFVTDSSLAENFYVITQYHCVVLSNKDTFTRDFSCTPVHVPCSGTLRGPSKAWWLPAGSAGRLTRRALHSRQCSHQQ